ncbi:tetraacyldisaccharide 4'-kinase [Maricaulis sp.]|uniref:tetraacyldisaccharide 4'-kinase n=1 Tax=Maricaulis sp. TaxID=1486257 RepID=UPI002603AEAC|nr:tetraacyldisaccharide 4'-kinase [Maricaulis sp.]
MKAPAFWTVSEGREAAPLVRALLSPLAAIYAWAGARRLRTAPSRQLPVPVICVGNLTLGGTGKTPVAQYLLQRLKTLGAAPFALSRGYGGSEKGPLRVDPAHHGAAEVGDEPLLLAQAAAAIISRDRPAGGELAVSEGASVIVMDDGHQNPSLAKTLSILVVDGQTGWGNGRVFPAGPLREPVAAGLSRADAVIVMMPDGERAPDYRGLGLDELEIPVLHAWLKASAPPPDGPLIAFAGIGRPEKFYDALSAAGGNIIDTCSFGDHHAFGEGELKYMFALAARHGAELVTTEKDWVRLPRHARERIACWPVEAAFAQPAVLDGLLQRVVDASDENAKPLA